MGLAMGAAKALLVESKRRPFSGSILTLGRQTVFFNQNQLEKAATAIGAGLNPVVRPRGAHEGLADHQVFAQLGFATLRSLDASNFEGADIVVDLNDDQVPAELHGAFDLIVDGGTMEHVFHVPNVLKNIFTMLKPGGRVMHLSPSSNHIDHGFYMFSPTLFSDYYAANDFEINTLQVFRYTPQHERKPWAISDYAPGSLDRVSYGGLDSAMYGIICVATKRETSTGSRIPQQRRYSDLWSGVSTAVQARSTLRLRLRQHPLALKAYLFAVRFRPKGLWLKVTARY